MASIRCDIAIGFFLLLLGSTPLGVTCIYIHTYTWIYIYLYMHIHCILAYAGGILQSKIFITAYSHYAPAYCLRFLISIGILLD